MRHVGRNKRKRELKGKLALAAAKDSKGFSFVESMDGF
jgi:hypothetical protein